MESKKILYLIYLLGFIIALHAALPAYINSSFLNDYISKNTVGTLYTLGSLFSLITLINAPRILARFGNYKTMLTVTAIEVLALIVLAFSNTFLFIAPAFIISLVIVIFIVFNLDLFLESFSSDKYTGEIRGKMLTAANVAWVISPLIAGFILTNGDYWKIYLMSAFAILIVFILVLLNFKKFKDPVYKEIPFWKTVREVHNNKDLYNIFISSLVLRFFYAWMVIYIPIYLHQNMGFSWNEIGIILTIMLLPFVLFETPLGALADKYFGEKEILSIGFIIISLSTISLSFITGNNILIWAGLLFISRIGASAVEIMTESYFFKHVDATDTNLMSFFRNMRNISYIIGPLIASLFLIFFDYQYLFLALGLIVLIGLKYSFALRDTK